MTRYNELFNRYIKPQTSPLALKLFQTENEIPEKVKFPVKDLGYQVALCQAFGMARRYGSILAVGKDDQCCIGGAVAMGFIADAPQAEAFMAGKKLDVGKYSHVLIAPFEKAAFEPDLLVLYVNPAQAMRLSHSAIMGAGQTVTARASGFGDCGDVVANGTTTNECQFILPSGGDRVYGSTQDHETIFTIPGNLVETIANGLEATHKMGFRYPVLTDMHHRPALAPFLEIPKKS